MGALDAFITSTLGLTKAPPYLGTCALAFVGFLLVHQVLAPWGSRRWAPGAFGKLDGGRGRNAWSIHVVSQLHALIIVPYALWVIAHESAAPDRAFGWDENVGHVHAIACGYFLWDSLDAVVNYTDAGFVVHGEFAFYSYERVEADVGLVFGVGIACLAIYTLSYKPFVAYYGVRCLLWETSTFFLNIHWFMDKTGRTGSRAQLVNGFFLLSAFFGVRILYGGMVSYDFLHTLVQVRREVPVVYVLVYGIGNFVLTSLNWFWFYKMISALRRRFSDEDDGVRKHHRHEERRRLVNGNGAAHGDGDVHVDAEEGIVRSTGAEGVGVRAGYGTR
ncbi:hypothetical protein DXG03_001311 [Asterophora parasitica]|uniref:TLC domain-containing protein n=1 Tax=Asterophora parasitica TaxID=117018 RepID=A0A9P7GA06_9AGAR|nr:hypothetical protein DXG03_001311 [Asterophora parasitica]